MKLATLAAQMIVYDDLQYIHQVLEPVVKYCDKVFIYVNKHPFNTKPGKKYDNSSALKELEDISKNEPKIEIVSGDWNTEEEERNFAVHYALERGYTYSLIVDTDEIYEDKHLYALTQVLHNNESENQGYWIFHANWKTYWKMNPLCVIDPPEKFQPVICVRNKNAHFQHLRNAVPKCFNQLMEPNTGRVVLPEHLVTLHHMSYARDDAFIKRKCDESGHSQNGDLQKDWYSKVWLPWKLGDKNLHPIDPAQYPTAVEVDESKLPNSLRLFFAMARGDL